MSTERINYLLKQYLTDSASEGELQELAELVKDTANVPMLKEHLGQFIETFNDPEWSTARLDEMVQNVLSADQEQTSEPSVRRMFNWHKVAVAASIIAVLGISSYFIFFSKTERQDDIVQVELPTDIQAPATNRAMITLSDGSTIYLDSAGNGTFATVNGVQVVKNKEGEIVYQSTDQLINLSTQYHTLTNPRGSKVIDMTLSDGSRVWLNAGSSVTYPVAFTGNERKVSVSGEAYFEVAHNPSRPFKVTKDDLEVAVLGTHFNVNAYDDEKEIKVTLMEGSVKVSSTKHVNASTILNPGQQAIVMLNAKHTKLNKVDLNQVIAWKNGLFDFNSTEIGEIMRQMERWYDMQVVYPAGKPNITLSGIINRDINASRVLEMLEMSGVHFSIQGKRVIVTP